MGPFLESLFKNGFQEKAPQREESPDSQTPPIILAGDGGDRHDLAQIAQRAKDARRTSFLWAFINAALLIVTCYASSILLALASGLVNAHDNLDTISGRFHMLDILVTSQFFGSALAWFVFVLLDGWFLYPPSRPIEGKRGVTRQWYDAITFMVNEEPAEVSEGLTTALNKSLRSKIKAARIFIWGLLLLVTAILAIAAFAYNAIFFDGFLDFVAESTSRKVRDTQNVLIFTISFGQVTNAHANQILEIPNYIAALTFILLPIFSLFIAYQLIRNSIDMRWSLLSTPDVLYKMLKHVLLVRNDARDYDLDDAVADARRFALQYGVSKIPEDFVDMDGELFFYSVNVRREFLKGTGVESKTTD